MNDEKMWTLPDRETMEEALKSACDVEHTIEKLFPKLLWNAGAERYARGIRLGFDLAVYEYLAGMSDIMGRVFRMVEPSLLRAYAGSDEAFEAVEATRQGRGE